MTDNEVKLFNSDCIEQMKKMQSETVDCIITSPPYWKGFAYEAYFNSYKQYLDWCKVWLKECKRLLKPNGTFYLNVINDSEITIRAFEIMEIATRELMYKLHDTIIWYRYNQQPANTNRQLTNQCEYVFMLRQTSADIMLNKEACYEKLSELFKTKNVGNVWELPFNKGKEHISGFGRKETKSKWGHSGFPEQLPMACVLLSTKENDTVMDCFMGSGTTGVVCKRLKRKFIGIEKDKQIFQQACERIEKTKKAAVCVMP